jgi:hypothetical protein
VQFVAACLFLFVVVPQQFFEVCEFVESLATDTIVSDMPEFAIFCPTPECLFVNIVPLMDRTCGNKP